MSEVTLLLLEVTKAVQPKASALSWVSAHEDGSSLSHFLLPAGQPRAEMGKAPQPSLLNHSLGRREAFLPGIEPYPNRPRQGWRQTAQ